MKKYSPLLLALAIIVLLYFGLIFYFGYPVYSMMSMNMLMGSWFTVFGLSKFFDITGFVKSFQQYDRVTQKFPPYGYMYPFIEFGLGIAYILDMAMNHWISINLSTLIISSLTTISILMSFTHPTKIHCACLGASTELTLGWITLVECGSMVVMAGAMIWSMMM